MPFMEGLASLKVNPHIKTKLKAKETNTEECDTYQVLNVRTCPLSAPHVCCFIFQ